MTDASARRKKKTGDDHGSFQTIPLLITQNKTLTSLLHSKNDTIRELNRKYNDRTRQVDKLTGHLAHVGSLWDQLHEDMNQVFQSVNFFSSDETSVNYKTEQGFSLAKAFAHIFNRSDTKEKRESSDDDDDEDNSKADLSKFNSIVRNTANHTRQLGANIVEVIQRQDEHLKKLHTALENQNMELLNQSITQENSNLRQKCRNLELKFADFQQGQLELTAEKSKLEEEKLSIESRLNEQAGDLAKLDFTVSALRRRIDTSNLVPYQFVTEFLKDSPEYHIQNGICVCGGAPPQIIQTSPVGEDSVANAETMEVSNSENREASTANASMNIMKEITENGVIKKEPTALTVKTEVPDVVEEEKISNMMKKAEVGDSNPNESMEVDVESPDEVKKDSIDVVESRGEESVTTPGEENTENGDKPKDSIIEGKFESVEKMKEFYESKLGAKINQAVRLQIKQDRLTSELSLSEERIVKSNAFKILVSQTKAIFEQLCKANERVSELKKLHSEELRVKDRYIEELLAGYREKMKEFLELMETKLRELSKERQNNKEMEMEVEKLKSQLKNAKTAAEMQELIKITDQERDINRRKTERLENQIKDLQNDLQAEKTKSDQLRNSYQETARELSEAKTRINLQASPSGNSTAAEMQTEIDRLKFNATMKDDINSSLERQMDELKSKLESEKSEGALYIEELTVTTRHYEQLTKNNNDLIAQMAQYEEKNVSLVNANIREKLQNDLHDKEKSVLEDKLKANEDIISAMQSQITEVETQLREKSQEVFKLTELNVTQKDQVEKLEGEVQRIASQVETVTTSAHEAKTLLKDKEKNQIKLLTNLEQCKTRLEYASSSSLGSSAGQGGLGSDVSLLRAQLDSYRNRLRCDVCNVRDKDASSQNASIHFAKIVLIKLWRSDEENVLLAEEALEW
eukprot:CAMPEP_0114990968 /NCGR_PEP_ID=MMETSP0216-20121206/11098_1 /TAXON_ID=223996 /ORGANISM="Protocruzia adherens, Strain Boccale" /LENGTH=919 /DNA_ID=CAMNT_0002354217 /DNA_START=316 /DNA_END=3073 /DNA_ORIENTATION=+